MYNHIPVLLEEAIEYLDPKPGELIADCTLGGGGYTSEIAKRVGKNGQVIAIDLDETAINNAKLKTAQLGLDNISFYHANFRELEKIIKEDFSQTSNSRLAGLVFDLGLSSAQLEDSSRGFSFQTDDPLNMAFGSLIDSRRTEEIVNTTPVSELASILREYGEERFALQIARSIAFVRRDKPITTTGELVAAISRAVPGSYRRSRLHFATRTFQALRIATNEELESLKILLHSLKDILPSGSRIVAISFHSLEDRIVKQFFKTESRDCICPPSIPLCVCDHKAWLKILTKKAIGASPEEISSNPRSRSAKLRAAITL
ncbi:MAG: 16S rRNA (cytosine(1402)-N(4))-methyltransferase RsmH [Candidatus Falkowbacteria bacterium]|nr:16S rRNA (cytosine(1402)-N(4))-methyltransferase RsmH [Candidatus Falkowbacteria bacterium]